MIFLATQDIVKFPHFFMQWHKYLLFLSAVLLNKRMTSKSEPLVQGSFIA